MKKVLSILLFACISFQPSYAYSKAFLSNHPIIHSNSYIDSNLDDRSLLENAVLQTSNSKTFHLFSHGDSGTLYLNGTWKNVVEIAAFLQPLLQDQSQLNIYGCHFAQGEKGKAAVSHLETALGVSIAASDDLTGVDGDWDLEVGNFKNGVTIQEYSHNLQQGTLPIQPGMAATTCGSYTEANQFNSDPNGYVFGIFDIREPGCPGTPGANAPNAPTNWANAGGSNAYHDSRWTNTNLGEVFGVDLEYDQASSPDIFLSSCGLSSWHNSDQYPMAGGTGGEVFRIDGTTGDITVLATLPSTVYESATGRDKFTGLGNLSYNADQQKVYVTNLDNGYIHVVDATTTGMIDQTYDPTPGIPEASFEAFEYTRRTRLVYGIEYNKCDNRLYFARPNTLTTVDIFSVGLNADGTIDASTPTLETTVTVETNVVISDIEFSDDCTQMLTSERQLVVATQSQVFLLQTAAHFSDVKRHDLSGGTWSLASTSYSIGNCPPSTCTISDKNAGGGVSFGYGNYGACGTDNACADAMVATSDALVFSSGLNIYGLQISDIDGTSSGLTNSYFVDLDGNTGSAENADKSTSFDVDVFGVNDCSGVSCTNPTATFTPTASTCNGATENNDGTIAITTQTNATEYGVSTAGATTYNGPMTTADATTIVANGNNVVTAISHAGANYIIRVFNGTDDCFTDVSVTVPAGTTCVAACTNPTATFTPTASTCNGATENNDGTIAITTQTNATEYGVSTAGATTYNGPMTTADATTIVANGNNVVTAISHAGANYIIRVFNGTDDCFTDVSVTVPAGTTCVAACTNPTATFTPTASTCNGATENNDGTIAITTQTNATEYGVSTAGATTYNGPMTTADATTIVANGNNVVTAISHAGANYIIRVFNGTDDCFTDVSVTVPAGTTCVAGCTNPTATFTPTASTCNGATENNDGTIAITTQTNATEYGVSTAGATTYNGPMTTADATTIVANGNNVVTAISHAGASYIIRVFNGTDDCFTDVSVTVPAGTTCSSTCTPPVITTQSTTICQGSTIDLSTLASTSAGTLTYHSATPADGTNVISSSVNPTSTTTYYVLATDGTCTAEASLVLTVDTPETYEICTEAGHSVTLTANASLTGVVWYNSADTQVGTGNTLVVDTNTTGMDNGNESFYYEANNTDACSVGACCPVIINAIQCCQENICLPITITVQRGVRD